MKLPFSILSGAFFFILGLVFSCIVASLIVGPHAALPVGALAWIALFGYVTRGVIKETQQVRREAAKTRHPAGKARDLPEPSLRPLWADLNTLRKY